MKLAYNAAVLFLAVVLGWASVVVAGDDRPIIAVFDIQTKQIKITKSQRGILTDVMTDVMTEELAQGGVFQVMPPGDVKRVLLEQSAESYEKCHDEKCLIELGLKLPANMLLTTTITKTHSHCRVAGSLYDLRRQTTDLVAKETTGCSEDEQVKAVEAVAAGVYAVLATFEGEMAIGSGPPPPITITHKLVKNVLSRNGTMLHRCADDHLAKLDAKKDVQVVLEFTIAASGRVLAAKVEPEKYKSTDFGLCLAKRMRRLRFPRHKGPNLTIGFPLKFNVAN